MMNKSTISIPVELAPKFEAWGILTAELFGQLRQRAGLSPDGVPGDQAWFWTPEWQAREREAETQIAEGKTIKFDNMDKAIKYLDE